MFTLWVHLYVCYVVLHDWFVKCVKCKMCKNLCVCFRANTDIHVILFKATNISPLCILRATRKHMLLVLSTAKKTHDLIFSGNKKNEITLKITYHT